MANVVRVYNQQPSVLQITEDGMTVAGHSWAEKVPEGEYLDRLEADGHVWVVRPEKSGKDAPKSADSKAEEKP